MSNLRPTLWRTCRVIANESRLRLLWMIFDIGGLSVSQLGRAVGISDQNASIQLRLMNSRGLISPRREGMEVIYEAEPNVGIDVAPDLLDALRECHEKKVSIDGVIRAATAFTYPRRIQIVRELEKAACKPAQLEDRTGIKARALYRHLSKLEARGFIRQVQHTYSLSIPKNPLARCLLQIAVSAEDGFSEPVNVVKVVSGGQTGADRAALDAAIACGVPHGGWCPKGRRAEDGPIDPVYNLEEMAKEDYPSRTKANVADSDVTVIFSRGPLSGGSLLTQEFAVELNKPCLHIDFQALKNSPLDRTEFFQALEEKVSAVAEAMADEPGLGNIVLNVAGPRASTDPSIYDAVYSALTLLLR
jgi:DNA-binding transcriptional ArsR family regulator